MPLLFCFYENGPLYSIESIYEIGEVEVSEAYVEVPYFVLKRLTVVRRELREVGYKFTIKRKYDSPLEWECPTKDEAVAIRNNIIEYWKTYLLHSIKNS
jgi:hypothetical protein